MRFLSLVVLAASSLCANAQESTTECQPNISGGGINCRTKEVDRGDVAAPRVQPTLSDDQDFRFGVKQADEAREAHAAWEKEQQALAEQWRRKLTQPPVVVEQARNAAQNGDATAQLNVGLWYWFGANVPKNEAIAVGYFKKGASQGDFGSQMQLAIAYASGQGIERDRVLAYAWYNSASVLQTPSSSIELREEAARRREVIGTLLAPSELREAQRISARWQRGTLIEHKEAAH